MSESSLARLLVDKMATLLGILKEETTVDKLAFQLEYLWVVKSDEDSAVQLEGS